MFPFVLVFDVAIYDRSLPMAQREHPSYLAVSVIVRAERFDGQWKLDIEVLHSDQRNVKRIPIASGPVGQPLAPIAYTGILEDMKSLVDMAIDRVVDPF